MLYFIDRSKIQQTLTFIDRLLKEFNEHTFDSFYDQLALERIVQMLLESILDVGNMMIDGFIMRDAGSYADIIEILVDEKVLPSEDKEAYQKLIKLRTMLVKDYINIDHALLEKTVKENHGIFTTFGQAVTLYLDNEIGANAFSNEWNR